MARELLVKKTSRSSLSLMHIHGCLRRYRRSRSSSSSKSQRQRRFVVDQISDDDFRTYRKFSADADSDRSDEGVVMSLIRRCRSRSNSRSNKRRRRIDNNDDYDDYDDDDDDGDDDMGERIELDQLSGFPLSRLSHITDLGHQFVTVYVDIPVWCDKCGHLIIGVYGHYVVCQCEYFNQYLR